MTRAPHPETFIGAEGNALAGRCIRRPRPRGAAAAWRRADAACMAHAPPKPIARAGMTAYCIDQRGHGDSEWVASGAYAFSDFAADVRALADQLAQRTGSRPVIVGASLGGIATLTAEGDAAREGRPPLFVGARAGRHHAAGRWRRRRQGAGLHARACARKDLPRSKRPPTRSPPICRIVRGRVRTRG